jgi:membrane-associated protein
MSPARRTERHEPPEERNVLSHILTPLLTLPAWEVYLVVGLLAFGEAGVLLGFFIPGETAVILGGVASKVGHASLVVVAIVAVVAAISGDSTGYLVGHIAGPRLLQLGPIAKRSAPFDAARDFVQRRGAVAVFLGRFAAFLRAVVPGLAGIAKMPYPRFLLANASGGLIWAVGYSVLGYWIGSAYATVERLSTIGSTALLAAIVLVIVGLRIRHARRERRAAISPNGATGDTHAALETEPGSMSSGEPEPMPTAAGPVTLEE